MRSEDDLRHGRRKAALRSLVDRADHVGRASCVVRVDGDGESASDPALEEDRRLPDDMERNRLRLLPSDTR